MCGGGQGGSKRASCKHRVQAGDSRSRQNMPRTEGAAGLHWEAEWELRGSQTLETRVCMEERGSEDDVRQRCQESRLGCFPLRQP